MLLAFVSDPPNLLPAIVRYQDTSVRQLHHRHRPAPHLTRLGRNHPASQKLTHRSARPTVLEWNKSDLVADALRPVPESMESQKRPALIFRGKLLAGVKSEIEHRHVRLQQHIPSDGSGHQIRPLAFVARLFMRTRISIGPAVKSALL